ncbi:hypothetical protein [Microbacterium tenebrionis]|uniref:hypothetical protein n=1 Tax=Microbacterium tenebrionis TaxID=2830665 RepID=UPI00158F0DBF|nr:hypothetical protein [Microbacterium ihumii]
MSTETLLRSTTHPPCPEDQEVLELTVPSDRNDLTLTDRLSLRLGLWLLLRTQRSGRSRHTMSREETVRLLDARRSAGDERFTEREMLAMLTHDMQRHML